MAGPQFTQFLAAGDYETFSKMVRHYNHDSSNCISRVTTECSIIARIIDKFPPEEIFTDPEYHEEGAPLAVEAKELIESITNAREYFWPPEDADTVNQDRWKPYTGAAWDKMIEGYAAYLEEHLQPVLPLFERLKLLEDDDAVRTDGKAASLAKARHSISFSIGELEELLTPESWEDRLDEWLKREMENA